MVKYVYDAWGNHAVLNADETNCASGIGIINPFRYRSYYYDTEIALYYLNSRYYDPKVCRFINADDVSVVGIYSQTLNGLNLYSYCLNNPVMHTDENGRWVGALVWLFIAIAGAVFAADAFIQALINYQHNPTGINLFLAIVQGIFLAIAIVTLVFAAINFVQSLKAVRTFSSMSSLSQSADDAVASTTDKVIGNYNPISKGDLSDDLANTFRSGTYAKKILSQDTTFYRVYGGKADKVGRFMSRTVQNGGLQSQIDLALNPAWGNTAANISKVIVPKGTIIYEGFASAQGNLLGGGSQIFIKVLEGVKFL